MDLDKELEALSNKNRPKLFSRLDFVYIEHVID